MMNVLETTIQNQPESALARTPPLEMGDRVTRAEFERRYAAMPQNKKAELIEGVVFRPSPVRYSHGKPHAHILAVDPLLQGDMATVLAVLQNTLKSDAHKQFVAQLSAQ